MRAEVRKKALRNKCRRDRDKKLSPDSWLPSPESLDNTPGVIHFFAINVLKLQQKDVL